MCLAADGGSGRPPGSTNRTTILGGGLGSGDELSGNFGNSGGGRGFGPGFRPPAARSSTLLTPAPSPGFDELDIGAGPTTGSKPDVPGFSPPDFGELDIGGPPSTIPAFAPPLDATGFTSPKLPKPKPISNSVLPLSALGTDLSPPPLGTLPDSKISPRIPTGLPSVASKPAVRPGPGLGQTGTPPTPTVAPQGAPTRGIGAFGRSEKPKAPAPGFSFPGEDAAAARAAVLRPAVQGGNEGPRPSRTAPVVSPELDKLLLTGDASSPVGEFLNVTGSLSGLLPGTQSFERAQRRLAELEKGLSQAERKEVVQKLLDRASSGDGGLTDPFQGRSTGELRAPSFRSEFVENNLLGQLTLKPLGETVAGLKALAGQDPVNPFSGRILSPREVFDSQFLTLTSAATGIAGNAIGRMKRLVEARLKPPEKLAESAANLRTGTLNRTTVDLLNAKIEPGKPRSLVRDAITDLLDGAEDTTQNFKDGRNYEKFGDMFEARAEFYAAVRNTGGKLNKVIPFQDGKGELSDLPDGTRIQWRLVSKEDKPSIDVRIIDDGGDGKTFLKLRYDLMRGKN